MIEPASVHVCFVGGTQGPWRVERMTTVTGPPLMAVDRVAVIEGGAAIPERNTWLLRGVTSYERYIRPHERAALAERQPALGRPEATRAALIPIKKSAAWWALTHDERRAIFEERSHHIATGQQYLPAIARRLHHSRELGGPFDFLTWFEYAPVARDVFDELVGKLRETEEWAYVEREVDLRMALEPQAGNPGRLG
jgi:hypothetical protein